MSIDLEALIKIKKFSELLGLKTQASSKHLNFEYKKGIINRYYKFLSKEKSKKNYKLNRDNDKCFKIYINDVQNLLSSTNADNYVQALKTVFYEEIEFHPTYFKLNKEHSELFLEICTLFKEKVEWSALSQQVFFNWTNNLIDKGISLNLWDWKELSKNPGISWDFDFVEKYKDYLLWKYVKVNKYLTWDEKLIDKYSKYIFSSESIQNFKELKNVKHSIGDYVNVYEFELNKNIRWSVSLIEKFSDNWNFKYLSYCLNINLPSSLLEKYIDKWDLRSLEKNERIKLDFSTIEMLKEKLDWSYIKTYEHLEWHKTTIDKYSKYIFSVNESTEEENKKIIDWSYNNYLQSINHSGFFESNINVIWSDALIDKYKDKWNWNYLVKNSTIKFTSKQLDKYKNYIDWGVFSEYGNTNWTEELIQKFVIKYIDKIVKNQNIQWTNSLFTKYIKNQNIHILSSFCESAQVTNDIVIKNQTFWGINEKPWQHYYKFSDETPYFDYTYRTLWHYLFCNANIEWNDFLLSACIKNIILHEVLLYKEKLTVEFINKYWDFCKEEIVWYSGNYKTGPYQEKEIVYLKDHFDYCDIINLNLEKLVINEFKWVNSPLINEFFINKSIENLIVSEHKKIMLK